MTAQPDDGPESIWRARPVLSGLLRTGIVAIPIASALGTTWIAARRGSRRPLDRGGFSSWLQGCSSR